MAGVGNLVDLLLFYTLERVLFNRMVGSMSKNPQLVKMAMAFWLLLEEIGYHDLTRKIHSFDNCTIEAIFNETISCLDCIIPNGNEPIFGENDSPVFVGILDEPISRRFFYYNSEFMRRRFTHIMETVCNRIFGENDAIEVDENASFFRPIIIRPCGEGSSISSSASAQTAGHGGIRTLTMNPNASEFIPRQTNEDSRTMFLTFSKGYPLSRDEVFNFFTSNWGDVVEDVVVEQAAGRGDPPLYGKSNIHQAFNYRYNSKWTIQGKIHGGTKTFVGSNICSQAWLKFDYTNGLILDN